MSYADYSAAMPLKNLYIRKGDESFWERAEAEAEAKGQPLSVWISNLIRNHLYAAGSGSIAEPTIPEVFAEIRANLDRMQELIS